MTGQGATHKLAAHVAGLSVTAFSDATWQAFERAVLDWAACTIAGASGAGALHRTVGAAAPTGEASILGTALHDSAAMAAFHNAYACHLLEYDDLHGPSIYHPGAPTISAAFAVAERINASAADLAAAIVAGYEVGIRVGEAAGTAHYANFHTTGTVGAIGAAAAAARVMRLDTTQTRDAIGTAATQGAALWAFSDDAAGSKPVHPAHAAMVGVLSADLARAGVTGAKRAIEGPRGFLATLGGDAKARCLEEGLDGTTAPRIEALTLKAYPCCGHTHTGIEAAQEIARALSSSGQSADDIASVTIATYGSAIRVAGVASPRTPEQAAFSYAHVVAWVLAHGTLDGAFSDMAVQAPKIAALRSKIELSHAPEFDADYPISQPVRLIVTPTTGRQLDAYAEHATGTPAKPMTDEAQNNKLRQLLGEAMPGWNAYVAGLVRSDQPIAQPPSEGISA